MIRPRTLMVPAVCVGLSLLIHVLLVSGDLIQDWLASRGHTEENQIAATQSKLKSQSIAGTDRQDNKLAGITPAGELSIQFGNPIVYPVHAQATPHKKRGPDKLEASNPEPVVAPANSQPITTPVADDLPAQPVSPDASPEMNNVEDRPLTEPASATSPPPTEPTIEKKNYRPVLETTFPNSVDIQYRIKGIIEVEHHWRVTGKHYEITTAGGLFGTYYRWKSDGDIDEHGLQPKSFTEWRDKKPDPKYQVQFDWGAKKAILGEPGAQTETDLTEGAQDMFSAAYQFALQGDRLPTFTIQILSGRHSYIVPFTLKGETKLWISDRHVRTLVLSGDYKNIHFSFYLAPEWHNLPVRIVKNDDKGEIDLRATSVTIDGIIAVAPPARYTDDTTP